MTRNLALIRLSAVNPFLVELKRREIDVADQLNELGLPPDIPASNDLFVAAETIYRLVEASAELSGDRYFGFTIGSSQDLTAWEPISRATEHATTVGELLTMFAVNAGDHTSASRFHLTTDGDRSTFGLERVRPPSFAPAQNDGFYMGLMLRLLKHATQDQWNAASVLFTVADPECIPQINEVCRVAKGDRRGVQITFPSEWLFARLNKPKFQSGIGIEPATGMPRSLVDSLHSALRPHLHDSDLTAEKAAKICGHDRRRLSRELRELGTTLTGEISRLRADKACGQLASTRQPVAEIGEMVGFTDPTVFSRAFKNWTGQSPRDYRRTHQSPN